MAKGSSSPPRAARRDGAGFTTVPTERGAVRVHTLHGKNERRANVETAAYLAEKHGYEIDLLPNLENQKSADAYNRTLGKEQEFKDVMRPTNGSIQQQLRNASKQADSIVLNLKEEVPMEALRQALNDRVRRRENITDVTIIMGGKDVTYSRAQMIADDFQIKRDDFK